MALETYSTVFTDLRKALDKLINQKATGKVVLSTDQVLGEMYFISGRLIYPVDKFHRVRRWERATKKHCPNWSVPSVWSEEQPWEYALLAQAVGKKQLNLTQVKAVTEQVCEEFFLELGYENQVKFLWKEQDIPKTPLSYCLSLSDFEIHPILHNVEELAHQWQPGGLNKIKPSLSPKLKVNPNSVNLPISSHYFSEQFTIWDIVNELNQPLLKINQLILPFLEKGIVELLKIPDFPEKLPTISTAVPQVAVAPPPQPTVSVPSSGNKVLIACIDDSAVVAHNLKKILEPAGYSMLSILEPMAGFGELIEHKPELILLDLNMPNANGYSVCKFLRETPVFAKTPIIILTSQDTIIDRTKAKLVGATDFIPKPPKSDELLQMIKKYLGN